MTLPSLTRREFLRGKPQRPLFARTVVPKAEPASPSGEVGLRAVVDLRACLSAAYQTCTICLERCGSRGAVQLVGALPRIDAARCTGCGECAAACPSPLTALRMVRREVTGGAR